MAKTHAQLRWHVAHGTEIWAVLDIRQAFLDAVDDRITVGRSIAFLRRHGETATLGTCKASLVQREHVVPCNLIVRHGWSLIDDGANDDAISDMV